MRASTISWRGAAGAALVAAVAAAAGCVPKEPQPRAIDKALLVISPRLTVRTDAVGDAGTSATFVLVDVDSKAREDAMVVLGGDLTDAHGAVVGHLRPDALRVPPGGRRTFALVDDHVAPRPAATGAKLAVLEATAPVGPPTMRITDGHVYDEQGRAVVAGYVVNESDHPGKGVVIAGFYDKDGAPMTRPFTIYEVGAGEKRPAQFVGPPGSKSAYIFVGETSY